MLGYHLGSMQTRSLFRWRAYLSLVVAVQFVGVAFVAAQERASRANTLRPNVLWVIADDLSPDLGCYGCADVKTPVVDQLAAEGVRYAKAFAPAPICSPCRSALITGLHATTIGAHLHRTKPKGPLPEGVRPITELLREAGYFVCNGNHDLTKGGKGDYNFRWPSKMYDGRDWSQRDEGQPFFAQVQIFEPHRPFHSDPDRKRARRVVLPPYLPDHPLTRADHTAYLQEVEVFDRKLGLVLQRLEDEGLADNTVVFVFGDHGRPQVRAKQWLYDSGLQVPLIVRWPGRLEPGSVDERLVSLLDVTAATLGIAGVPLPKRCHGIDFLDPDAAEREVVFGHRDRSGDAVDRIRCVRTDRFKYIRNFHPDRPWTQQSGYKTLQYPVISLMRALHAAGKLKGPQVAFMADRRPEEELYDLDADPHELVNLAGKDAHRETLVALRERLDAWIEQTGDRGEVAEPNEAQNVRSSQRYFERAMKRRGMEPDAAPSEHVTWWQKKLKLRR